MTTGFVHTLQWVSPPPLWAASAAAMRPPAILRFASDRFVEDLQAALAAKTADLSGLVARWESFRERYPGEPDDPPGLTPKLYQPAHGRFYLVTASLVCRRVGLPDHLVDPTHDERAAFVLRRRGASGEEAWVPDPSDPTKRVWAGVVDPLVLMPGEDLFPLFPVPYTVDGSRRRLLVGLVPTSSRETFESAAAFAAPDAEGNPLLAEVRARVVDPYQDLLDMQPGATDELRKDVAAQQTEASRFLLLDLADFLNAHLPDLWQALQSGQAPGPGDPGASLYSTLDQASADSQAGSSWRAGLVAAWNDRARIATPDGTSTVSLNLAHGNLAAQALDDALAQAVPSAAPPPPAAAPTGIPKLDPRGQTTYTIRCVFQRPRCGALRPDVVSADSAPFTIAPFFDADAPGRPIRIVLPDPSIASLRRFKKNVGMVTSAALRRQMARVGKLQDALKGDFSAPGGGIELDEVCTFSIPIITLCAFIVLMIFLALLNLVFWWLPFLKICFPLVKKE
ncbi:MAG TPA: hypothetical protein VFG59_12125 [Anaeromyxobacter sp.]|nr:hypothetical protein [Anaeromyxobacter sp.]